MSLSNLLEKLISFEAGGFPVISVYLNAESDQPGRDQFGIWLKNELAIISADYANDSSEAQSIQRDVERIMNFAESEVEPSANGIAVFACFGADEFFETVQLETAFPNNRLFVFNRPHIFPLVRAIEENPRYMVLWADTNKADIYIFGGEHSIDVTTETNAQVEEIENVVTGRSKAGGWSQGRFQRRLENFHLQHAKETIETVEKLMRDTNIRQLVVGGDESVIMPHLLPQLPKAVEECVIGTLNLSQYDSEDAIHQATVELIENNRLKSNEAALERAIGASKSSGGLGVTGIEETLAALSNGQVEELVISSSFQKINYSPKKVNKVLKDYAPGDDNSSTGELPDAHEPRQMADELLIRALNTDAKIRFVEESDVLKHLGGVVATLRYNLNSTANG